MKSDKEVVKIGTIRDRNLVGAAKDYENSKEMWPRQH